MTELDDREAFFQAVRRGDVDTVRAVLARQPELASATKDGASALHWAAWENRVDVARLLVQSGADLDAEDDRHGMLPIAWANEHGHMDSVVALAEMGGTIPLPLAAGFGLVGLVRAKLSEDPGSLDESFRYGTALQYAALWGQAEVVRLLLDAGADTSVVDLEGRTPLEVARTQTREAARRTMLAVDERKDEIQRGCAEVVALLEAAQAAEDLT